MISSNGSNNPQSDRYNLGPKSRLKGFHKSHNIKSYCNKPSPHLNNPINILNNQIQNSTTTSSNDEIILLNVDQSVLMENQQYSEEDLQHVPSLFGTSFLLSNDYLTRVDGSMDVSIYQHQQQQEQQWHDNRSRNVELDGQVILFHRACKEGSLRSVMKMLEMNESLVNALYENVTPLYASIQCNCYEVFCELLKRKTIDIRRGFCCLQDVRDGQNLTISCLYLAIHVGNYKMVDDLLTMMNVEDINSGKRFEKEFTEYCESPLFLAVRMGDLKMLQTLLKHERFWYHFDILKCMVSKDLNTTIVNTVFQALFSIEGKSFLEREKKSKACFLEIKKMYNSVEHSLTQDIEKIASVELISPPSALHFSRCSYSGTHLKTIHSPLYLSIMNENDCLTRELVNCVPNKFFGELVVDQSRNEFESCIYLAIYKRSIHVIIYLLREFADTMEDVSKLKEFALGENIDLNHFIKIAQHFTNQMYNLSRGIENSYCDLEIIASDYYLY